jgi:class 3 adenylate cyclase
MPLFMDRHDLSGSTAADAAAAHVQDLAFAAKYDVEFVAYWFDDINERIFCLAKTPSRDNLVGLHDEAHGQIPNKIISVAEGDVLRFLGKIEDPADAAALTNPFRTILFTDLAGSTAMMQEVGESAYMVLLTEHDLIIRRALVASRGREVKHTGDGIMASFDEVAHALECSLAVQRGFAERVAEPDSRPLRVRIGMAAGEPVTHDDDIFGSAVNRASRICDVADPGQILVGDAVHSLGSDHGFVFDGGDPRPLKGFAEPMSVFELLRNDGNPTAL